MIGAEYITFQPEQQEHFVIRDEVMCENVLNTIMRAEYVTFQPEQQEHFIIRDKVWVKSQSFEVSHHARSTHITRVHIAKAICRSWSDSLWCVYV